MDGVVKMLFGAICPYTEKPCEDFQRSCYECHIEQEEQEFCKMRANRLILKKMRKEKMQKNEILQHKED